jgi:hypothetical protein
VRPKDFSSHEISGCDDPYGGSAAIYPTICECQKALDALNLHSMPYDVDYIEGIYSDYTCSDDDFYPEAKGAMKNSSSISSEDSAATRSGSVVDSDSNFVVDSGVHTEDIYPLAHGKIEDTLQTPSCMQCLMASQGNASGSGPNGNRDGQTYSGRLITQAQISRARRIYNDEEPLGLNPVEDELATLRFIVS